MATAAEVEQIVRRGLIERARRLINERGPGNFKEQGGHHDHSGIGANNPRNRGRGILMTWHRENTADHCGR